MNTKMVPTQALRLIFIMLITCVVGLHNARAQDSWVFRTIPIDGNLTGLPGDIIGWGYEVQNLSSNHWLYFSQLEASGPFEHSNATSLFAPFEIAPNTTIVLDYDNVGGNGLYELQWNIDAPIGFSNIGAFSGSAGWYNGNPFDSTNPGQYLGEASFYNSFHTKLR